MPSNFSGFEVGHDKEDGTAPILFGSQTVKVYDVTNNAQLADLVSDAGGAVASGTLPVAVGTLVRFYWQLTTGVNRGYCAVLERVTT